MLIARLAPTLASMAFGSLNTMMRRVKRNAVLYALALVAVLTAYGALVVAGGLYLAQTMGPLGAALTIAGGMIGLAVLLLIVVMIVNRLDRRRHQTDNNSRMLTASVGISMLPLLFRSKALLGTAAVGGLLYLAARVLSHDEDEH